MTHFPSLPDDAHLGHFFAAHKKGAAHLFRWHDEILRGPSELTIAERELIAAYVSGSNECGFCYNSHRVYAESFGIDTGIFDALMADVDTADIDDRLKPILRFARKLTLSPYKVVTSDVDAMLDVGWSEDAIADVIKVTATFNMMNRIIFGAGLPAMEDRFKERRAEMVDGKSPDTLRQRNETEVGSDTYSAFGRSIGIES